MCVEGKTFLLSASNQTVLFYYVEVDVKKKLQRNGIIVVSHFIPGLSLEKSCTTIE